MATGKTVEVKDAPSPEAEALAKAGATPVAADVEQLIRSMQDQIAAQQAKLEGLYQSQGIPSDPVEAGVANVKAHVQARRDALPQLPWDEVRKEIDGLDTPPTVSQTESLKLAVEDLHENTGHHDLGYLKQLARDLHRAVLKVGK